MKLLHDVPAPAKLNLFLHITGQRPDGYHLLQSVFMLIDWCDTLHFENAPARHQPRRPDCPAACRRLDHPRRQIAATTHRLHTRRAHRGRQTNPSPGRHGRRLVRRGQLPARTQPALGPETEAACARTTGPATGRRRAFFPARTQRLGGRHWRANHPHRTACGAVLGPQTPFGRRNRANFYAPGASTGHKACYNFGLRCSAI